MKRILITGITGYIGSHLARALLSDWEVCGLVRHPVHTRYIADIQDQLKLLPFDGSYESMESAVRQADPQLVYHLAAHYTDAHGAQATPALVDANIKLGAYLLEAMSACGVPALVYASTVMMHYQNAEYRPLNLYAATKRAFSDLLAYYTDAGLLRAVTLVLSDTYGPGDHRAKVLNLIKQAIAAGEPLALSDGGQDYDVVYIDDVVQGFQQAGEQLLQKHDWENEVFQISASNPLTLRQTVEYMLQINGASLHADWGRRPASEREIRRSVRLHPPVPGWQPQIVLEEGLRRFWSQ